MCEYPTPGFQAGGAIAAEQSWETIMRSTGWIVVTVALGACAGDRAVAPGSPAVPVPIVANAPPTARIQATRQSLTEGRQALQNFLRATEAENRSNGESGEVAQRRQRDVAEVSAAIGRLGRELDSLLKRSAYTTLSDGTPVYPDGTALDWVNAGTWVKLYSDGVITASSQYSQPVFLHTTAFGNTSRGWQKSSDEGWSQGMQLPQISDAARPLMIPSTERNCNLSAVSFWGSSVHTAQYAKSMNIGPFEYQVAYQYPVRLNTSQTERCDHIPLTGELGTSGTLGVGETGSAGVIWKGAQSSNVTDCPTTWSASPSGIVTLGQGSGSPATDSRSVYGAAVGTATITASCRGVSKSTSMTVLAARCLDPNAQNRYGPLPCTYPPPQVCEDATASNFHVSFPCDYSSPGGGGGPIGGGPNDPPPPTPPGGGTYGCWMVQVLIASYYGEYYLGSYWADDHIECGYRSRMPETLGVMASITGESSANAQALRRAGRRVTIAAVTDIPKGHVAAIMQRSGKDAPDVVFIDVKRVNSSDLAAILQLANERLSQPMSGPTKLHVLTEFGWKNGAEAREGGRIRSAAKVLDELRTATKRSVHRVGDVPSISVMIGGR